MQLPRFGSSVVQLFLPASMPQQQALAILPWAAWAGCRQSLEAVQQCLVHPIIRGGCKSLGLTRGLQASIRSSQQLLGHLCVLFSQGTICTRVLPDFRQSMDMIVEQLAASAKMGLPAEPCLSLLTANDIVRLAFHPRIFLGGPHLSCCHVPPFGWRQLDRDGHPCCRV